MGHGLRGQRRRQSGSSFMSDGEGLWNNVTEITDAVVSGNAGKFYPGEVIK